MADNSCQPMRPGNPVRCKARNRKGQQCTKSAIPGGTVCYYHGGASPQVKAKAEERLRALVDPAIARLGQLVKDKQGAVANPAVKLVLGINGYSEKQQVQVAASVVTYDAAKLAQLSDDELSTISRILEKLTSAGSSSSGDQAAGTDQDPALLS